METQIKPSFIKAIQFRQLSFSNTVLFSLLTSGSSCIAALKNCGEKSPPNIFITTCYINKYTAVYTILKWSSGKMMNLSF